MESIRPETPRSEPSPRQELRALAHLRDRIEAAAAEIERLRAENAALSARVVELQASGGGDTLGALLSDGEDVDALRARIQGFIAAIDGVISPPEDRASSSPTDG